MTEKPKFRNTRVAVTLSPEALRLLSSLSALTGQPKAALLSELVDTALPALQTTVEALNIVKEQPREAQRLLANFGAGAIRDLSQSQIDFDALVDARTVQGKRKKRGQRGAT
jgi:predicted DNA-binding protein